MTEEENKQQEEEPDFLEVVKISDTREGWEIDLRSRTTSQEDLMNLAYTIRHNFFNGSNGKGKKDYHS